MSLSVIKRTGIALLTLTLAATFSSTVLAQTETNIAIKVYLEGAGGGVGQPMRTDLWSRNLLDTNKNQTQQQIPCSGGESTNPSAVSTSFNGVVLANGYIVRSDRATPFVTVDTSLAYHVVVYHRSHLPIASPAIQIGQTISGMLFHDFTQQSIDPITMQPRNLINGQYAMYAGDVNQDRFIDGGDVNYWNNGNGYWDVYQSADANLNGDINGSDKQLIDSNDGLFSLIPYIFY